MTEVEKTMVVFLPSKIEGLDGTGWEIKDGFLYVGFEEGGEVYKLPTFYETPPENFVGVWEF